MKAKVWMFLKNYRFSSLFFKYFILLMAFFLILFFSVTGLLYYSNMGILREAMKSERMLALSRLGYTIDNTIKGISIQSRIISENKDIMFFATNGSNSTGRYSIGNVVELLDIISSYSTVVQSVYVYSEAGKYVVSNKNSASLDRFYDNGWVEYYNKEKDLNSWLVSRQVVDIATGEKKQCITMFQKIAIMDDTIGALVINLDATKFFDEQNQNLGAIQIMQSNGEILYTTNNGSRENSVRQIISEVDVKPSSYIVNGTIISSFKLPYCGLIVEEINLKSQYQGEGIFTLFNFLIIILGVLVSLGLAFLFAREIFKPFVDITDIMGNQYTNYAAPGKYKNEVSFITENILKNLEHSKKMEEEMKKQLKSLNDAQVAALQSQINPHFLHNTLWSIYWMVVKMGGGTSPTAECVSNLSTLLRLSMEGSEHFISIKNEVKHSQIYVELMKMRLENGFEVVWNVDKSVEEKGTVKVILQPLIENAITHGISKIEEQGKISVTIEQDGKDVLYKVSDNGCGIDENIARGLLTKDESNFSLDSNHIGINNINKRLQILFGTDYGVTIKSSVGNGTTIELRHPIIEYPF